MKTKGIRLRWFNDACYEIGLPNGKGILIDPYITHSKYQRLPAEAVEAAEYIFISHTHFDHVMDLGAISTRFDSRIFVGQISGVELARQYDVPGYRMNLCAPGDCFEMEDFTLECFRGRHTKLGDFDRPSQWPDNIRKDGLDSETMLLNMLGSYEYMIYLLTLPDHTRLMIWGGGATPDAAAQAKRFQPHISIAQLPRETPGQIARLYAAIGGQFIFPHHHDGYLASGEEGTRFIQETIEKTAQLAPQTTIVLPEKGKWYTISTSVTLAE